MTTPAPPSPDAASKAPSTFTFIQSCWGACHGSGGGLSFVFFAIQRDTATGIFPLGSLGPFCCLISHSSSQYLCKNFTEATNDNLSEMCNIIFNMPSSPHQQQQLCLHISSCINYQC
jgi:hypothetical protein